MQRLAEVLGGDPGDSDVKFELRMAFDLLDLFAGFGVDLLRDAPTPRRSGTSAART